MSENYTLTPALGLFKPNYRKDSGKWGDHWNFNADLLDAAFSGNFGGPYLPISGGHVTGKLQVGSTGWLEPIIGATEAISDFVSLSKMAGAGGVFGTRTSDGGATGGMGAWSIGAFAINNNTTAVQTAYGHYTEVRRYANAGTTHGMEICTVNHGDLKQNQPYYMGQSGSTLGLWIGAGRDDVASNNNPSLALGIIGGNTLWDRGIMFGWNSVRSTGPNGAVAIGMPPGHAFVWFIDDGGASQGVGVPGAIIRADMTSVAGLAHPPSLLFGNGALSFDPGNNVDVVTFEVGKTTLTGKLNLSGLPTSATGLNPGDVWRNGTTLNIV
jgi:hypothetical protein